MWVIRKHVYTLYIKALTTAEEIDRDDENWQELQSTCERFGWHIKTIKKAGGGCCLLRLVGLYGEKNVTADFWSSF